MRPTTTQKMAQDNRPIWEIAHEIGGQVPEDEWKKVPADSSINYRHYLYGAPKKSVPTSGISSFLRD